MAVMSRSLVLLCVLASAVPAAGQEHGADGPRLAAAAVDAEITIDGRLDELVWEAAEVADRFVQREPDEYAPATEPTRVRVLYDPQTLYIGVEAIDSDPRSIVALEMQRDGRLFRDDGVAILLGTFDDHRSAYFFETNPNGARTDGLVSDEGDDFNIDWDGVWSVASRIHESGWTAEFAIPLRTLRFDPRLDQWSLQIRRSIRRKNEETFFAPLGLEDGFFKLSKAGHLTGLRDLEPGLALNVKPYVTAAVGESDVEGSTDDGEVGLDLKWGVTRGLGLDVTVNTDFAETEVDEVQVNLTRFSLFFPEKREFFLENSGIFEFGTPGGRGGPLFRLFFSRRIGISEEGDPVPLEWGARLAGKASRWSLGLIQAHTGSLSTAEETVLDTDWTVARVKREVGRRSSVGALVTRKEAGAGGASTGYGVDWTVRPTNRLSVWGFAAASDVDGAAGDDDGIAGTGVEWRSRLWEVEAAYVDIGEDFDPTAGFLRRSGVANAQANIEFEPRPAHPRIRNLAFELEFDRFTRDDGSIESEDVQINFFGVTFESGHTVELFTQFKREGLDEPFEISDGVVLPVDDYEFHDWGIFYRGNEGRRLSARGFVVGGEYYDGRRFQTNLTGTWRPSRRWSSETTWNRADIDLPAGDFVTNLVRQRLSIALSPDIVLSALAQYSNVSDELGLNVRFNWIYRPGADLFIVYNQGWLAPDGVSMLDAVDRRLAVKFTYLFQR